MNEVRRSQLLDYKFRRDIGSLFYRALSLVTSIRGSDDYYNGMTLTGSLSTTSLTVLNSQIPRLHFVNELR